MQIGLFYEPGDSVFRYEFDRVNALVELGWELFPADDLPHLRVPDHIDVAVVYLKFRTLLRSAPLDWGGFTGLRAMFDQDTMQNYANYGPPLLGKWPKVFRRHRFDHLVGTSRFIADRLEADGIPTSWTPEAIDPERFRPLGEERSGLAFYGSPYAARLVMLRRVEAANIQLQRFKTTFDGLNAALNRFSAVVICNMGLARPPGRLERAIKHVPPLRPGQMFAKNFEVAAAGCAPICDIVEPDLELLGFVHGKTALIYSTFDELIDILRSTDDDELQRIGSKAAKLCADRHTWAHRADELTTAIEHLARSRT